MQRFLKYNRKIISTAKELRKNMTEPEKKIWFQFFKYFQQTYKIRVLRQRTIKNFIVDFYIPKIKLVIEIDGESHFDEQGIAYDTERTQILEGLGLKVIRFTNKEIMNNFNGVCETILKNPFVLSEISLNNKSLDNKSPLSYRTSPLNKGSKNNTSLIKECENNTSLNKENENNTPLNKGGQGGIKTQAELKPEIIDKILSLGLSETETNPSLSKDNFHKLKNKIYSQYKLEKPISSIELIDRYDKLIQNGTLKDNPNFKKILRKRGVRSQSGVTVISLLTKSFGCPGKCIYCPSFEKLPKSYIPNEPAVMRASLNEFDPIKQIWNRLRALEITGHKIDKNDVRIIGGTWSFYPKSYQEEFIKGIYDAFNLYYEMKEFIEETDFTSENFATFKIKSEYKPNLSKDLEEAKKINETAKLRVIGIAIETRPDWINDEEIFRLRKYGITRVEIGYQTTFDEINKLNKRGHGNKESIRATKLLKDAGFKVVAHMMPNLLGSTPEKDIASLKEIFENPDFRPDELKIYPMVVTKNSELTKLWEEGKFKPYDDETLINLTTNLETIIPEYVRLNRTYRDIPSSEILAGSHLANLRQIVENKLKNEGKKLVDIRHREIKFGKNDPNKAVFHDFEYEASEGIEHFLTFEDPEDRTIFSLLRLRLPKNKKINEDKQVLSLSSQNPPNPLYQGGIQTFSSGEMEIKGNFLEELQNTAIVRELHTFGEQLSIGENGNNTGQHLGFGKKLILEAENIAKKAGFDKISIIAGVGVREYYKKRGYYLEEEYMVKEI